MNSRFVSSARGHLWNVRQRLRGTEPDRDLEADRAAASQHGSGGADRCDHTAAGVDQPDERGLSNPSESDGLPEMHKQIAEMMEVGPMV